MSMSGQQFHQAALELRRLPASLECLVQFQNGALRPFIGGAGAGAQADVKLLPDLLGTVSYGSQFARPLGRLLRVRFFLLNALALDANLLGQGSPRFNLRNGSTLA